MSDPTLREVVEFVADWAHDCSPSNAATPWERKHGDEIDPRVYGFDDIEQRCRAALDAERLAALSATPALLDPADLSLLTHAVTHLLSQHNCDRHGWRTLREANERLRAVLKGDTP